MRKLLPALLLVVSLVSCRSEVEPPANSGILPKPLHVDGRFLRDAEGRAVLLHGMNGLGSKTPPYGADITEGEPKAIAAMGMNHVRMILGWASIMPQKGVIDYEYLKSVRKRAEMAAEYDLWVIADMHQDIFGEGIRAPDGTVLGNGTPAWVCSATIEPLTPWMINYVQDAVGECYDKMYTDPELIDLFAQTHRAVIEVLYDLPNFLGVELLNEPFIGTHSPLSFDQEVLTPWYDAVYAKIADLMPGHLLFVEPSIVKNLVAMGLLDRLPNTQTVYSPHLYDSRQELGQGYDGNTDYLDFRFGVDLKDSKRLNAPLWIGEWGNPPHGAAAAQQYMHDFLDRADSSFTGRAFWEMWVVNNRPEVVPVLSRPYVERGPGLPTFAYDRDTKTLTLEITGDGKHETLVRGRLGARAEVNLEAPWTGQVEVKDGGSTVFHLPPLKKGVKGKATLKFE